MCYVLKLNSGHRRSCSLPWFVCFWSVEAFYWALSRPRSTASQVEKPSPQETNNSFVGSARCCQCLQCVTPTGRRGFEGNGSRDSSASIATGYGMDGPGSIPGGARFFSSPTESRMTLEPT
jgi:hypothetical protein